VTPPGGYLLGFDIGGTRLKSGVVAPDGSVDRVTLDDTDRGGFEDTVLPLLRDHARRHLEATGPGCIGIGIALPGIVEASLFGTSGQLVDSQPNLLVGIRFTVEEEVQLVQR